MRTENSLPCRRYSRFVHKLAARPQQALRARRILLITAQKTSLAPISRSVMHKNLSTTAAVQSIKNVCLRKSYQQSNENYTKFVQIPPFWRCFCKGMYKVINNCIKSSLIAAAPRACALRFLRLARHAPRAAVRQRRSCRAGRLRPAAHDSPRQVKIRGGKLI